MSYNEQEYDAFEKRMYERFPKMFAGHYGGFDVGSGWWPILEALCGNIQSHVDWRNQQKERFHNCEGCEQVVISQIKEKFGGLRFYYDGGDDTVDGMVRMAEAWAVNSCEICGSPGKRRDGGWTCTLCDFHEEEIKNKSSVKST